MNQIISMISKNKKKNNSEFVMLDKILSHHFISQISFYQQMF